MSGAIHRGGPASSSVVEICKIISFKPAVVAVRVIVVAIHCNGCGKCYVVVVVLVVIVAVVYCGCGCGCGCCYCGCGTNSVTNAGDDATAQWAEAEEGGQAAQLN